MQHMTSKAIRQAFLDFFVKNDHQYYAGCSLVSPDPSLLFTSAGMVQLVPFLKAEQKPPYPRLVNYQKSFRTGDINDIGSDGRHLTFFEMLGQWSIGDYYKERAIELAYDLLVNVYGFDPNLMYASVFAGNEQLPKDKDSIQGWLKVGIPRERIIELGYSDNFWIAGQTGPCGPCTEVYYDMGTDVDPNAKPGTNNDRFIEIWNAGVFMEYFKDEYGNFNALPQKNVDTGAGLERLAAFMQGKKNVFDIDLFRPLVDLISLTLKVDYDHDPKATKAVRIIADHIRASTFLVGDGVKPSNVQRGYVLRRLLRRAIAQARLMGNQEPILARFVSEVIDTYQDVYPELDQNRARIVGIIEEEEKAFAKTLNQGLRELDKILAANPKAISGDDAFKLHDTYGFPIDLTREFAEEKGIAVDIAGFDKELQKQKDRSRIGSGFTLGKTMEKDYAETPLSTFVGYETLSTQAKVVQLSVIDDEAQLVLDQTSFYGEGGGQTGDKGEIVGPNGKLTVTTTKKTKRGVFVHVGKLAGTIAEGESVTATVDEMSRKQIMRYHTATHLLHKALRDTLGPLVQQKGSSITADRLRFDFNFDRPLTAEEIVRIEQIVTDLIRKDLPVVVQYMPLARAKESGAMALFEGKYDQEVRVLDIGSGISRELCGGTHVTHTGEIGQIKIDKQESVGGGIRRIKAV